VKIRPFRNGDAHATFRNLADKISKEIDSLDNEYVLKASATELEQYYLEKAKIEPIVLHSDQYYIENQAGTRIEVHSRFHYEELPDERITAQGTQLDIAVPYEGDSTLWKIRPSSFTLSAYPEIEVRDDSIVLTFTFRDDSVNSASLKTEIDSQVRLLADAMENLRRDVSNHNNSIPRIIKTAFDRKRQKALAATNAVDGLGIPMKRKDTPPTFTLPTKRRKSPARRPTVPTQAYSPEPALDEAEYEHILEIIRGMSLVIERNPASFASLNEEDIRTHFLIQLNGHYEGSATGETFNAAGKTDILIRVDDRNVFISECKFWRGPKAFSEAVDQLLGYLSWRDSKCALLIFNKNKNSSAVRQKMHEIMESCPEHRKTLAYAPNGDARYVFVKASDPGREIVVTAMLFDIPQNGG
jgi:hypothetical protein